MRNIYSNGVGAECSRLSAKKEEQDSGCVKYSAFRHQEGPAREMECLLGRLDTAGEDSYQGIQPLAL